jgi:hypothetical protein
MTLRNRFDMGESSPVKGQVFFHNDDMDTPLRQTQHYWGM